MYMYIHRQCATYINTPSHPVWRIELDLKYIHTYRCMYAHLDRWTRTHACKHACTHAHMRVRTHTVSNETSHTRTHMLYITQ